MKSRDWNRLCLVGTLPLVLAAVTPLSARGQNHAGIQHGAPAAVPNDSSTQQLLALLRRMMADPVIRERVANYPGMQAMLRSFADVIAAQGPQESADAASMGHRSMAHPATDHQTQLLAEQFIARLLAKTDVQERIQTQSTWRRLWADPELRQRLANLRVSGTPDAAPHKHD